MEDLRAGEKVVPFVGVEGMFLIEEVKEEFFGRGEVSRFWPRFSIVGMARVVVYE